MEIDLKSLYLKRN